MQRFRKINRYNLHQGQSGFTLLEVLIAIGITALIGLGTWQLLGGTIKAQEITQKNSERFEKLQKAMLLLSRDIQQVNTRTIRDEYGDFQPAFTNKNTQYILEFTRSGWRNPMGDQRSDLQRVTYELVDGELLRHYWHALDRAQEEESVFQTILTDVDTITIQFMNDESQWAETWPPELSSDSGNENNGQSTQNTGIHTLPKAVEITIQHNYFGSLVRLYDLPQYVVIEASSGQSGGNEGESDDSNEEPDVENEQEPNG